MGVRHLDNLIDINVLPIPEATKSDQENRAIGLGVMGLSEAIELMRLGYEDKEAFDMADKIFEFISYSAIDESANLAQERGAYKNCAGSSWSEGMVPFDTIKKLEEDRGIKLTVETVSQGDLFSVDWNKLREKVKLGMRNSTLMAVAPNANS